MKELTTINKLCKALDISKRRVVIVGDLALILTGLIEYEECWIDLEMEFSEKLSQDLILLERINSTSTKGQSMYSFPFEDKYINIRLILNVKDCSIKDKKYGYNISPIFDVLKVKASNRENSVFLIKLINKLTNTFSIWGEY